MIQTPNRIGCCAGRFARTWPTTLLVLLVSTTLAHAQAYGGRAYGAAIASVYFADTGSLPPSGGDLGASVTSIQSGVLSTGPADASCSGIAGTAESSASVDDVVVAGLLADVLTCTRAVAQAGVSCAGVQGSSAITGLAFAGVVVQVTGAANQTVTVPGIGTLVINEQIVGDGSITVNALHLSLATGVDLVLCGCSSSYVCPLGVEPGTWGGIKALYI